MSLFGNYRKYMHMKSKQSNSNNVFHDKLLKILNDLKGEIEVFIKINLVNIIKDDNVTIVSASLMTKKMLSLDQKYLFSAEENTFDIYHPYFCEFESSPIKNDKVDKRIKDYESKWRTGKLIFDEPNVKKKKEDINIPQLLILTGNIIFAASPIIWTGGKLIFNLEDDEITELQEYDIHLDEELQRYQPEEHNEVLREFGQLSIQNLRGVIYNVGQGNFIKINCRNQVLLFDIGFTISEKFADDNNNLINQSSKVVNIIKPNIAILSHWDLDHIIGVTYMEPEYIYSNNYWIAPYPVEKTSVSAKRLCVYLMHQSNIYLVKNQYGQWIGGNSYLNLWKGRGEANQFTRKNNIGLVLTIETNNPKQIMLFAGDCEWNQMPPELFEQKYRFIVVSHHGAKQSISVPLQGKNSNAYSIICVGKNSYGHPNAETIEQLNFRGLSNILFTPGLQALYFKFVNGKGVKVNKCYNLKDLQCKESQEFDYDVESEEISLFTDC